MKKYIALLRGINISGKNKIPMPELKRAFEELGFFNVITYINSGNAIFEATDTNEQILIEKIEKMISHKFNISIPVAIISIDELEDILGNAPVWWGKVDKEVYDNLILPIPPTSVEEIFSVMGEAKQGLEMVSSYKRAIYWSASLKTFSKTNWNKIASSVVNDKVTIRNANTIKKLLKLAKER